MPFPPSRILVVDDVAENRHLLLRRLKRMELTDTAEAADGKDALRQIREGAFDLVLLDVMMPEMNGIEVLRHLRAENRLDEMPVLMISAATEIEKVVECIELGAEDYLPKPFNPALLTARVRAALERRHLRAENRQQFERFKAELEKARVQQLRMVPDRFPVDPSRWDLAARMEPALEVGGDLYDVFEVRPGVLCVAIGDVAGKGLPAALFMARTRSLLRGGTLQRAELADALPQASEITALLNRELCKNNSDATFVTLFLGFLDLEAGTLDFCNAGHVYPLVLNAAGTVAELATPADPALGVIDDFPFADHRTTLRRGDLLLFATDGLGDTCNERGEALEGERIAAALREVAGCGAATVLDALFQTARSFEGTAPQFDDVTLLALKRLA